MSSRCASTGPTPCGCCGTRRPTVVSTVSMPNAAASHTEAAPPRSSERRRASSVTPTNRTLFPTPIAVTTVPSSEPPVRRRGNPTLKQVLRRTGDNPCMTARVLVVDDDPSVRSAISRALRTDYDVDEAADGVEALAQHAARPADTIVLDLLMPQLGGLDVCRSLRRRDDPVPILVVTARDAVDDRVEGLDAGADDYLV